MIYWQTIPPDVGVLHSPASERVGVPRHLNVAWPRPLTSRSGGHGRSSERDKRRQMSVGRKIHTSKIPMCCTNTQQPHTPPGKEQAAINMLRLQVPQALLRCKCLVVMCVFQSCISILHRTGKHTCNASISALQLNCRMQLTCGTCHRTPTECAPINSPVKP